MPWMLLPNGQRPAEHGLRFVVSASDLYDHRQSIQAGSITGILAAEFFCDPNGGLELVLRIRESVLLAQPSPFVHQFLPSRFGGSDLTRLETWRATSAGNPRTTIRGAIERR